MSVSSVGRTARTLGSYLLFACLLLAAVWGLPSLFSRLTARTDAVSATPPATIIVDAGHGGMDGGAESVTGSLEKDLNLALSQTLSDLLRVCGYSVIETRTEDVMLDYPKSAGGSRKTRDLAARLAVSRANPDALFLSIHMNKFPIAKYSGLQVYYGEQNPASRTLAQAVQQTVRTHLQPENTREVKASTSAIYLLHRMEATGILVECGFLSNAAEAAALDDSGYRTKLAVLLAAAATDYENNAAVAPAT